MDTIPYRHNSYKIALPTDTHCPYHDPYAVDLACQIISDYKPDILIHGGDGCDFYAISRFSKDPRRAHRLQEEIDVFGQVMGQFVEAAGDIERYMLVGNHEERVERYLRDHPELYGLRALKLANVLGLPDLGFKLTDAVVIGKTRFIHGEVVRKHSAYAAKAHLENCGYSHFTFHGHTHRMGWHFKTTANGPIYAVECGTLADPAQADYMQAQVANWQRGLVLVEVGRGCRGRAVSRGDPVPWRGWAYERTLARETICSELKVMNSSRTDIKARSA